MSDDLRSQIAEWLGLDPPELGSAGVCADKATRSAEPFPAPTGAPETERKHGA